MEFKSLKKNYTNINEPAKKFLKITRDEYGLCSYIQYRSADPRQKIRGWCCDNKLDIAEWVGVSRAGLYKMIDRLSIQSLIESDAKGNLSVTSLWIDTDNQCKQSLQKIEGSVNKVDDDCKQSLHQSVNKVTHNKEYEYSESIDRTKSDNSIPAAKKTAGKSTPNPNWSQQIATLFDEVNKSESQSLKVDFQKFNWLANPGRQFAALKKTRLALIPDLKEKQPPDQKHEPTEEEISIGFEYLFRYGFRYLATIAENKGNGGVQFSPAIILNNYNQILQYAKQNHTTKQDRAKAKHDQQWADFIREVVTEGI